MIPREIVWTCTIPSWLIINPLLISFKFKTKILELKANKVLIIFFSWKNKHVGWVNMDKTGTVYANTTSERFWAHCAILSLYQLKSRDNRWGRLFQLRNRSFCHYLNKCKIYKVDRKQNMNFLQFHVENLKKNHELRNFVHFRNMTIFNMYMLYAGLLGR